MLKTDFDRWKFGDVALQAGDSHKMWMGLFTVRNFVVSHGQMRLIAVVTAEGAVVNIHTLGAICEGILMFWVSLIWSKHLVEMLAAFLVYKAVIQDGGWLVVERVHECYKIVH